MSATPIPRTLHMSLVGLRDMSVIETPPKDRLAIQTVVAPFDEKLMQSALEQELERGGQVYFVHNRVERIWDIAAKLQKLVPKARIRRRTRADGGRRTGESDAEVHASRSRHPGLRPQSSKTASIFRCANTMFINHAERWVFRSFTSCAAASGGPNRRAYAYLLVPSETELTPIARRRLAALKEFSDLGAGFKIAALDLELRGAGNMLGGEQSGHIEAIGFELYTQMLDRAVRELKGEMPEEEIATQLNLGLNIRIPAEYIPEENQRLRMYKRVAGVEREAQLHDVRAELIDRYGEPPLAVRNLLDYADLKLVAVRVGVNAIERKRDQVSIKFRQTAAVDPERLARFVASQRGTQFTPDGTLKFLQKATLPAEVLGNLKILLEELAGTPSAAA